MKRVLVVFLIISIFLPAISFAAGGRRYLSIGADPVCPQCPLEPGEELRALPRDVFIETRGKSGRRYEGWLRKGELIVVRKTVDPYCKENEDCYVGIRIWRCGNPLTGVTHPSGSARILFVQKLKPTVYEEPPTQRIQSTTVEAPAVVSPPPVSITLPPRCSGALPVIGGVLGSLLGLASPNPWIQALLGGVGGIFGAHIGTLIAGCQMAPSDYLEAGMVGAAGGVLWRHGHHPKAGPNPPGVRTPPNPPAVRTLP